MVLARVCVACETAPRHSDHDNTKYCQACSTVLRHRPPANVSPAQAAMIRQLRGTMIRRELARHVGISQAQLHRYLTEHGLDSNARDYPPEVVTAVCTTYAALGKRRTQELFPDVVVRCIIERHKDYPPRQVRWTGEHQIEAVRMAGLVSHTAQAHYFNRPNAYEGSIKKFWARVVGCAPRDVHGLGHHLVWRLATAGVPAVLVTQATQPGPRAVVLWLDLVHYLREDVDPLVRRLVEILARFQGWVFSTNSTEKIRRMITEREAYAHDH